MVTLHMHRKLTVHVDGGQSGGSCVPRPVSEDPHWRISYICVNVRHNTENWHSNLPGSALKVSVGGWLRK